MANVACPAAWIELTSRQRGHWAVACHAAAAGRRHLPLHQVVRRRVAVAGAPPGCWLTLRHDNDGPTGSATHLELNGTRATSPQDQCTSRTGHVHQVRLP